MRLNNKLFFMKTKIYEKLKTEYSPLGFSDTAFNELADKLAASGMVKDDNIDDVVKSAGLYLAPLQSEIDRRVGSVSSKSQKELNSIAKSLGWESWDEMSKSAKKETQPKTTPELKSPELPDEIKQRLDEIERKYKEISAREAEKQAKEAAAKFSADVKSGLLKKEVGCADDLVLRLVLHNVDNTKTVEENVAMLKEMYDKESSAATEAGYYIPQSKPITVQPIDKEKRDAEEKEFAESMKNSIKQI